MISRPVRIAIPSLIFGAMTIFVVAQSTWFLSVALIAADATGQNQTVVENLTVWGAIAALWNSGSPFLGVCVALACVAFPYVKMLLLLAMWLVPTSICSVGKREFILVVLDQITKISIFDCSLFLMMIVGLQVRWKHSVDNSLYLKIGAIEPIGYVAQILAAGSSMFVGHLILVVHRIAGRERQRYIQNASVINSAVLSSTMATSLRPSAQGTLRPEQAASQASAGAERNCSLLQNRADEDLAAIEEAQPVAPDVNLCSARLAGRKPFGVLTVLLFTTLACIFIGVLGVEVFNFRFAGVIASVNSLLGNSNSMSYTMWGIFRGNYITEYGLQAGEIFVTCVLIVFCLVVPIAYILTLIVLWICPLSAKTQFHVWLALQVLQAWGGLDIFVVAMLLAQLTSSSITEFLAFSTLTSNMGPICRMLKDGANLDCIDYKIGISPYTGILVFAVISWHLCGLYVYRLMLRVREGKLVTATLVSDTSPSVARQAVNHCEQQRTLRSSVVKKDLAAWMNTALSGVTGCGSHAADALVNDILTTVRNLDESAKGLNWKSDPHTLNGISIRIQMKYLSGKEEEELWAVAVDTLVKTKDGQLVVPD
jgi:hypothetical protein